jgi:two-component system NtrC family response regulator
MGKNNILPILIVEDDIGLHRQLRWSFEDYDVQIAADRKSAILALKKYKPHVITLDLGLPPDPSNVSEGLATLEEILEYSPTTKVIVVTGNEDRENAVRAIGMGAYDFYQKPVDMDVLKLIVDRAFHLYELEEENRQLLQNIQLPAFEGIIASSENMMGVKRVIERVAPTDVTVLLQGESGTGKEVFARAIHNLSHRKSERFVVINCASIPENLLESELFGYEKGAFTGAVKQTIGKIEYANGGTLLLDEAGDLPLSLQAKLLRFLQERTVERIGGRKEIEVDVRVICATNQNLEKLISEGKFREDLYYRFKEITIELPPLCDREGDVSLIARAMLNKFNIEYNRNITGFTDEALFALENYNWPGNVRELENKLKRAVIMEDTDKISARSLELASVDESARSDIDLPMARERLERQITQRALRMFGGNVSKAAEAMGISRPTLYSIMEKYNIKSSGI